VSALGPAEVASLQPCESLYVSPHADDVFLSCPGRLLQDQGRRASILVVTLFDDGGRSPDAADVRARFFAQPGVQHLEVGLPAAPARDPAYATFRGLTQGRQAVDEECLGRAVELLADVGHRTRAREVFLPLGVGQHIDHRLAHEASRGAFPPRGSGRNVFLYEERPEAFVPGAVGVRLSQVGARLPPAAVEAVDRAGLARLLVRFHVAPAFRGDLKGWGDRLRSARLAARQWRESRAWHPLRGFGPRLQPVVDAHAEPPPGVTELMGPRSAAFEKLGRAYSTSVGGAAYAERYWLLLPAREADGMESLPAVVGEESRDA
jgi:LmbE family N-acetylglucosaminyl deacetylase